MQLAFKYLIYFHVIQHVLSIMKSKIQKIKPYRISNSCSSPLRYFRSTAIKSIHLLHQPTENQTEWLVWNSYRGSLLRKLVFIFHATFLIFFPTTAWTGIVPTNFFRNSRRKNYWGVEIIFIVFIKSILIFTIPRPGT